MTPRNKSIVKLCLLPGLCGLGLLQMARADDANDPLPCFVRFSEDGHGGGQMQAAVASYMNDKGVTVDLLATMHIGEPAFFKQLAQRFPAYDLVLYELVARRGERAIEEGVNDQQEEIARDMKLDNQGPHIVYTARNFVHADLDLEQIQSLEIKQNGTFKGALGDGPGIKSARGPEETAGDAAVFKDIEDSKKAGPAERVRLMRRAYSRNLALTARPAPGTTYPEKMEVLVSARNDRVMKILKARMDKGARKIAILYGAAHMVDLEDRLLKKGFHRQSIDWQTAWTVEPDGTPTTQPLGKQKAR